METIKNIKDYLKENLNSSGYSRSSILYQMSKIKNGKEYEKTFIEEIIYKDILRKSYKSVNMDFGKKQKSWDKLGYSEENGGLGLHKNRSWFYWNPGGVGQENYNLYYTISKSDENIGKLYNNFGRMTNLAYNSMKKYGPVEYKTQSNIENFCEDNDNLKFYFKTKSSRDMFKIELEKFFIDNDIKIEPRLYTTGFDLEGKSYGMLMSEIMSEYLIDLVKKNNNLPDEKILDFFMDNYKNKMPTFIKMLSDRYNR